VSIFNEIPGVEAYLADGIFEPTQTKVNAIAARKRNFFLFSLMKTMPVSLQSRIYDTGNYRMMAPKNSGVDTSGVSRDFMNAYYVLDGMSSMTTISEGSENTFMFIRSNITHSPEILQEPDFTPASIVDNSAYYPAEGKTITYGDSSILLDTEYKITHYHVNMKALMQLGAWFDELRASGVYDNTRIIIVSDHGRDLGVFDTDPVLLHDIDFYLPMLLVKDFGAEGLTYSNDFMTNADVPTLAMDGLIESPVNPFTGNAIDSSEKTDANQQYVIVSIDWDVNKNNGNQFLPAEWAAVSGDVADKENWVFYTDPAILPPEFAGPEQ
jgi:hypothetical protein